MYLMGMLEIPLKTALRSRGALTNCFERSTREEGNRQPRVARARGGGKVWDSGLGLLGSGPGRMRSPRASAVARLRARPAGSRGYTGIKRGVTAPDASAVGRASFALLADCRPRPLHRRARAKAPLRVWAAEINWVGTPDAHERAGRTRQASTNRQRRR